MDKAAPDPLAQIRNRIDAIDEKMHRLLIERSTVIAELIEIKGASKPGGAFRPEREADMMRRMAVRHEGSLPLFTVEHIWREIITTFTAMQAPFGVLTAPAADPLALRDLVRFYFGFSVAVTDCTSPAEAIAQVARSDRDIAVIPADSDGRWWEPLTPSGAPKVFAKLPFIETPARPAFLAAYVVGPKLKENPAFDLSLLGMPESRRLETAILSHGGAIAARADNDLLIELPVAATVTDLERETGSQLGSVPTLGGFFQPIRFVAERTA